LARFSALYREDHPMRRLLICLFALALIAGQAAAALAQATAPADAALAWMRTQQQPDGSFPGFGPGESADAVLAFAAAGQDPTRVTRDGRSALDYLATQAASYGASSPGAAAKLVLAAVAAGQDPTSFGGTNLLELIGAGYDPASGQYGADVYGHALALIATRAVGASPPPAAVRRLLDLQLADGGWSFDGAAATGSDTNTTSLAVQALVGQRQADGARARAIAYLKGQQNDDGGFPYAQGSPFGNASDANSTAAVIQAILAAGEDPAGATWTRGGQTPLAALAALQNASGALRYQASQPDDNALATYQAVPALLRRSLPVTTATVPGAAALLAPAATTPPGTLPATGAAAELPAGLALAALALGALGLSLRRRTN